jgi:hypothetical protein
MSKLKRSITLTKSFAFRKHLMHLVEQMFFVPCHVLGFMLIALTVLEPTYFKQAIS